MKKSFVLHLDSLGVLQELSNEQAGILFKAIKSYHHGEEAILDFGMRMVFLPFRNQFIRDAVAYQDTVERNRGNGLKGGRPKKETQVNPNNPSGLYQKQNNPDGSLKTHHNPPKPKKADSDSDSDSVNDSVSDKEESIISGEIISPSSDLKIPNSPKEKKEKDSGQKEKTKLQGFIQDKCPNVSKLKDQLTHEESERITEKYPWELIEKKLMAMENKKDLTKKYVSVNLTLNNWCSMGTAPPGKQVSNLEVIKTVAEKPIILHSNHSPSEGIKLKSGETFYSNGSQQ